MPGPDRKSPRPGQGATRAGWGHWAGFMAEAVMAGEFWVGPQCRQSHKGKDESGTSVLSFVSSPINSTNIEHLLCIGYFSWSWGQVVSKIDVAFAFMKFTVIRTNMKINQRIPQMNARTANTVFLRQRGEWLRVSWVKEEEQHVKGTEEQGSGDRGVGAGGGRDQTPWSGIRMLFGGTGKPRTGFKE